MLIMPEIEGAVCAYVDDEPTPAEPETATGIYGKSTDRRSRREALRKPAAVMSGQIQGPARGPPGSLKPALVSILDACAYLGGVSRAKFYADILPKLETVKLGRRNFVVVASMDRLIEANRRPAE